jgi:hypothetical protein
VERFYGRVHRFRVGELVRDVLVEIGILRFVERGARVSKDDHVVTPVTALPPGAFHADGVAKPAR